MFHIPEDKLNFIIHEVVYIANDLLKYGAEHATEEEQIILKRYILRLTDIRKEILNCIYDDEIGRF